MNTSQGWDYCRRETWLIFSHPPPTPIPRVNRKLRWNTSWFDNVSRSSSSPGEIKQREATKALKAVTGVQTGRSRVSKWLKGARLFKACYMQLVWLFELSLNLSSEQVCHPCRCFSTTWTSSHERKWSPWKLKDTVKQFVKHHKQLKPATYLPLHFRSSFRVWFVML